MNQQINLNWPELLTQWVSVSLHICLQLTKSSTELKNERTEQSEAIQLSLSTQKIIYFEKLVC